MAAEAEALLAGLDGRPATTLLVGTRTVRRRGPWLVAVTGVGPAAAAVAATDLLGRLQPDAVVAVGVGGAYDPGVPVGALVVGTGSVAVELGREAGAGVVPFDLAPHRLPLADVLPERAADRLEAQGGVVRGEVATVQTVTTTAARGAALRGACVVEAMEGFGVASAAAAAGVPCGEWRAVSNPVAGTWDLPAGLAALTRLGEALS